MTEKVNAHTVENIADAAEELQKNFDFIEAEANKLMISMYMWEIRWF